jgi:uncharacterized surface protein with fasciclin (FAS1) repeats
MAGLGNIGAGIGQALTGSLAQAAQGIAGQAVNGVAGALGQGLNGATQGLNGLGQSLNGATQGLNGLGVGQGVNGQGQGVNGFGQGLNGMGQNGMFAGQPSYGPNPTMSSALTGNAWNNMNTSNNLGTSAGQYIQANGNNDVLASAAISTGLANTLSGSGPFTIFAPTDAAFNAYLAGNNLTASQLLANPQLSNILKNHIVAGRITPQQILSAGSNGYQATALSGLQLTIVSLLGSYNVHGQSRYNFYVYWTDSNGKKMSAQIVGNPFWVSNGIIYPINAIIA